jgi:Flp pilus assembly protein TadD
VLPAPARLRIAVLAFKVTGTPATPEWAHLVQSLIASQLTGEEPLAVLDPSGTDSYLETVAGQSPTSWNPKLGDAVRRLDLDFVIDGRVVGGEGRRLVQADLIEVKPGEVEASETVTVTDEESLPGAARALSEKFLTLLRVHALGLGRTELRPFASLRTHDVQAVRVQASQYIQRGQSGRKDLLRAIEIDPAFIAPRVWLISGLVPQGELEESRAQLAVLQTLEADGSPFEQALIRWAGAYVADDLADQARHLDLALAYSPGNNILISNLAWIQAEMGNCEQALPTMRPALDSRFRYPPLYALYGACAIQLGRLDEARTQLEAALELPPVDPDTYALLEAIQRFDGGTAEADRYARLRRAGLKATGDEEASSQLSAAYARLAEMSRERGHADRADWLQERSAATTDKTSIPSERRR